MARINRRAKIIRIASHLMSQKGYKAASIQEIADRAGIHKSTFFHYFKNKEDLLMAVLRVGLEDVTRNLELIIQDENLPPREKLRQAIINHLGSLVQHMDYVSVYHSEIRFLSKRHRGEYLKTRKSYASLLEKIIIEIKESDARCFKSLDAKIVTFAILGMCNWLIKWYEESGRMGILDIADTFYKLVMSGSDH